RTRWRASWPRSPPPFKKALTQRSQRTRRGRECYSMRLRVHYVFFATSASRRLIYFSVADGGDRPRDAFQRLALGFDADRQLGQRRRDHQACAEKITVEHGAAFSRADEGPEQPRRNDAAQCGPERIEEGD